MRKDEYISPEYAQDRGREEYRSGWYSPYAMGDNYSAQEAYDEGAAEERRAEDRRREAKQQAEYEEELYWQQCEQQRAEEQAYEAEMQRQYLDACGHATQEQTKLTEEPKKEETDDLPF
jgi:hypothetical protein